ncbi:hypothetical protein DCAR_0520472 [Daucus carota subsp. sativus]|uniref:F-box associated domain-containing protein n=1 Tax=Daucus carota subsp. sativus TaxID=79200 RepID=A0A162A1A2_DAUCS|nr:hypothetical protein DCAR_0520472 [Daucus carota subsp. sativus]
MNPLLVTSVLVPQPTLPINVENLDVFGFGCMGFDFKIIRIVQSGETGVEVYRSLEGRWSQINVAWPVFSNNIVALMDVPLVPLKISTGVSTIRIGKKLYWLVKEHALDLVRGVISFDLDNESFEVVKTFSSQDVNEGSGLKLGLFKGHLVVAKDNERGGFDLCSLGSGKWKRCSGSYPLQPAYVLGPDHQIVGPFPHMETLILNSKRMPSVIAAILS